MADLITEPRAFVEWYEETLAADVPGGQWTPPATVEDFQKNRAEFIHAAESRALARRLADTPTE